MSRKRKGLFPFTRTERSKPSVELEMRLVLSVPTASLQAFIDIKLGRYKGSTASRRAVP
jgi:hypothetical protein